MNNRDLAQMVLQSFERLNVITLCICPGARNSPLVDLLSETQTYEKLYFFDERSAGFFALGRMKQQKHSVAVLTTSGTAAGELLPATMEAHYSHLPLLLITADRPVRYRGSGAPQAAEQVGLFGHYVQQCLDWSVDSKEFSIKFNSQQPIHINVCFDEPLIEKKSERPQALRFSVYNDVFDQNTAKLQSFLNTYKSPLVILGGMSLEESKSVASFLQKTQLPFYAEGPSQLRETSHLDFQRISNLDRIIERAHGVGYNIDGILRIGSVPTHRFWRDLESKSPLPVLSISSKKFSGLPQGHLIYTPLGNFFENVSLKNGVTAEDYQNLKNEDAVRQKNLETLLAEEKYSEAAQIYFLSQKIKRDDRVYLGNSLPIREWDLAATREEKNLTIDATRGLNGIDGQISYFFGGMTTLQTSWALLGDLTVLYDLQGPWILKQLQNYDFKIVIVNNGGGKIFDRMFGKKEYLNEHGLRFKTWAQMWELSYEAHHDISSALLKSNIIEVLPASPDTQRFWEKYEKL